MKTCIKCLETKSLEMFTLKKNNKDGYGGSCKSCHALYMRKYYTENPEKANQNRINQRIRDAGYDKRAFRRHGLSEGQARTLLEMYEGACWICRVKPATCVDHDHSCCSGSFSCGKCVRGMLCSPCNTSLGLLRENEESIQNMLKYILPN